MKISDVQTVTEMAKPVKLCPKCGKSMAANHYWYKGGWKCKGGAGASPSPTTSVMQDVAQDIKQQAEPADDTQVAPAPAEVKATPSAPPQDNSKKALVDWLTKHGVTKYTENEDGSINVQQDVDFRELRRYDFPVQFGTVDGDFMCSGGSLTSLKGAPKIVTGDFWVNHNKIDSLVGSPERVEKTVSLASNPFASLEGITSYIGESLWVEKCPNLKSLHHIHKHIKYIGDELHMEDVNLEDSVLGILLIKGLKEVKFDAKLKAVSEIINKHLQGDKDINMCQDELIDAGFPAFAKL